MSTPCRSPSALALVATLPLVAGLILAGCAAKESAPVPAASAPRAATTFDVFYGSPNSGTGNGLSLGRFDSTTGALTAPRLAVEAAGPSFFVITPDGKHLYACHEPGTAIAAYAISPADHSLKLLNTRPSGGADPCHISLDATGKFALIANYTGGSVAVFAIAPDGSLGERTAFDQHIGKGPHPNQGSAHAHCILTDPTNRFALCADLGTDKIFIYKFDAKTGALTPNDPAFGVLAPGAGPRHLLFSKDGKVVYVTNELNATVTAFHWDGARGTLTEFQTISNLPVGYNGPKTKGNAELALHPNGKVLYASNRDHDSIAVLAIDPATAKLTLAQDVPTRGVRPRYFGFDPTGGWIIAGNQESNTAAMFRVDAATGKLAPIGEPVVAPAPICMAFLPIPPAK